jgi:GrpB-like predicted nucleotidyltransferase (UPF0157 family)/MOSC domain-containing protein YiiM
MAIEPLFISTYERTRAECRPWDPRAPEAARLLADAISERLPSLTVEHVGSSAVPGCAGKGVIDLMVVYERGQLEAARRVLDELCFQHQSGSDVFPEDRPMRVGAFKYKGTSFRVHAHVIAADSPEVSELITFRDRLRNSPELLERYVARKRAIIGEGISDPLQYARAQASFVEGELGMQTGWNGVVERIYIGTEATLPMTERWEVVALDGKGLEGDRYAEGRGTFSNKPATGQHVTLVEAEAIEAVAKERDIKPDVTRRNIVTRGVPLNHLVGAEFQVGEVVLRGMRLCEPCSHLGRLAGDDDLKTAFLHRGGLRAEIVRGGRIKVKDPITPGESQKQEEAQVPK